MTAQTAAINELPATVIRETLTDGSEVWNVRYSAEMPSALRHCADPETVSVTFGCASRVHARDLASALNAVCWTEID